MAICGDLALQQMNEADGAVRPKGRAGGDQLDAQCRLPGGPRNDEIEIAHWTVVESASYVPIAGKAQRLEWPGKVDLTMAAGVESHAGAFDHHDMPVIPRKARKRAVGDDIGDAHPPPE